jgi:hypothetical protein
VPPPACVSRPAEHLMMNDVSTASSIRTAFATPAAGDANHNRSKHWRASPQKLTSPAGFGVQQMRDARCENRKQQRPLSAFRLLPAGRPDLPRHNCPRKLFRFQIVSRRSDVVAQILSRLSGNSVTAHRACFASATVPSSKGQPSTWFKPQRQPVSEARYRQAVTARQGLTGGGLWC